jgi:ABC-type multidrug transport system fused ATPase/permease subunit
MESGWRTIFRVLALGRDRLGAFLAVAVLVSLGTGASLLEPWIYRAIIDDIAGVFVTPAPLVKIESALESLTRSFKHVPESAGRIAHAPLRKTHADAPRRRLEPRSVNQAFATILLGALAIVLLRAASEGMRLWGDNRAARLSNEIERGLILRVFRHTLRLPLSYFTRRASGAVARQIDQSDQIAPIFNAFSQEIWPQMFSLIAILAILVSVNRELALVVLLVVPLYGWLTWRMSRRLDTELDEYYERWDEVSSRIQQGVAGIKTIQAHGTAEHESSRLDAASRQAYGRYLLRNRIQNRYVYAQQMLVAAAKVSVLAIGGLKALQHQLTPGDVVLFLAYVDRVYDPIEGLMSLYTTLQQNAGSVRRAERILRERETEGEDLPALAPSGSDIEFDRVAFSYSGKDRRVLDEVTFRVREGERVALVGPSGAGKTTLTDLLMALYRPQSGSIRIGGQALSTVAPSSVRSVVRGVAADGVLFRDTLVENIRYGRLDATDQEVRDAATLAGLDPVLDRLPDGMATPIGERGVELSVGERQRVLLARAFLARPAILVLDEATANLDFKTEAHVKEALERLSRGRTTLVVAHRKSMLTDVDRVLVLRDGRIEQDGTPGELIGRAGYFRQMMSSQEVAGT